MPTSRIPTLVHPSKGWTYIAVKKNEGGGFPGGAVVKNLPANTGFNTRVQALIREYPTCRGATKPVHHNY